MRILQLGLVVALTTGLAVILIYISGVSHSFFCTLSLPISAHFFSCLCLIGISMLFFFWLDETLLDQDLSALESLHREFKQCMVSFSFLDLCLFRCGHMYVCIFSFTCMKCFGSLLNCWSCRNSLCIWEFVSFFHPSKAHSIC